MTPQEVKERLKVSDYGTMRFLNKYGKGVTQTGTIVFITKKGSVVFYGHDKEEIFLVSERIDYFTPKEMLPAPTKHKGKDVVFDQGRWVYVKTGKEADISR